MSFSDLPLDLQASIFSDSPTLVKQGMSINPQLGQRMKSGILELCQQKISLEEFKTYLTTLPRVLYICTKNPEGVTYSILNLINVTSNIPGPTGPYDKTKWVEGCQLSASDNYIYMGHEDSSPPTMDQLIEDIELHYQNIDVDYDEIILDFDFDLLTTYRILSSRLSCIQADPLFAFNETKRRFEQKISELSSPYLYAYLITQTWIFNINVPVHLPVGSLTAADLYILNAQIEKLIPMIYHQLEKL